MAQRRRAILLSSILVLPATVTAQATFNLDEGKEAGPAVVLSGTPTIDLITVKGTSPGIPLRYGGVVAGSESVDFEGRPLKRGVDYQIDYEAGVIYLMRAQKAGQIVRVSYRYDREKVGKTDGLQFGGLPTFTFDMVPGSMRMMLGFGMTERRADGNVITTNLFGWNNSFNLGNAGSIDGLMLFGEKEKVDNRSGFEYQNPGEVQDAGRSRLILQSISSNFAGGSLKADYQDISQNFSGFSAVGAAGFDQKRVGELQKERGLKRYGLSFSDVNIGGLKFGQSFRTVQDGGASIDWRTFNFGNDKFNVKWDSQHVDQDFKRFNDIAEDQREQLKREAGLDRETFAFNLASGRLKGLSLNTSQVEGEDGEGIYRRELKLDAGGINFKIGDQKIDSGFNRFNSLFEQEKGQWSKERGLRRDWLELNAAILGQSLALNRSVLSSDAGSFRSESLGLNGKGWSLQHVSAKVDEEFENLNAMAESEMDGHIQQIASMYPNAKPNQQSRQEFFRSQGLDRSFSRFNSQLFKGWKFDFQMLNLEGQEDGADVQRFSVEGPKFSGSFQKHSIGAGFNELNKLMRFEQQHLGPLMGLDKTDLSLNMDLGGNKRLAISQMKAETAEGGASREQVNFESKDLSMELNRRNVDPEFENVHHLVDPEKDFLRMMRGFHQQEFRARWQINPSLEFKTYMMEQESGTLQQQNHMRHMVLNWKPDGNTHIGLQRLAQRNDDPLSMLFANFMESMYLMRSLGKYGTVQYLTETKEYEGSENEQPDSKKQFISYETKINQSTSLKSEQTRMRYEDGAREDISKHTVSTEISKNAGLSVSDIRVDRGGDNDEVKRDYGFWLNLGGGMKLSYGYNRAMIGDKGTLNSNFTISPGTLGFMKLDSATYTEQRWDDLNTKGTTNLALSSSKPVSLGFLRDMTFNFGLDTASDQTAWVRENKLAAFAGKIGSNTIGFEYRSQIHQTGFRGIDRTLIFKTDDKSWISADLKMKMRDLPTEEHIMIRDFKLTARPSKDWSLSHQLLTNPEEKFNPNFLLGSQTSPWRVNKWTLNFAPEKGNTAFGATWEEKLNDITKESSRVGGVTLDLFKNSGSPLGLFYGVEQKWGNGPRQTAHRYWLRFDQRPGPNQLFSIFAGNVSYEHSIAEGFSRNNWSLSMNYQLKF